MKQKSLHVFFLELILNLVILSVAMGIALAIFMNAAQIDQKNRALQRLSTEMIRISEELRNPERSPAQDKILSFDSSGLPSTEQIAYVLNVKVSLLGSDSRLETCTLQLTDTSGQKLAGWDIRTRLEMNP